MDANKILEQLRHHPESAKIGMIASHLGVVRGTSRSGEVVESIEVEYDTRTLENIRTEMKDRQGIMDVVIETNSGHLSVGDTIMFVAVAGDIRENVFPVLVETIDRIKKEASRKKELLK